MRDSAIWRATNICPSSGASKMEVKTKDEWESICRHCGKCCLIKLEDEDSGEVYYTNVICRYFDEEKMCCSVYEKRTELVPACLKLSKKNVDKLSWMPKTCAYRELFEKRAPTVHTTIKGRVVSESEVNEDELEDHIVTWEDL